MMFFSDCAFYFLLKWKMKKEKDRSRLLSESVCVFFPGRTRVELIPGDRRRQLDLKVQRKARRLMPGSCIRSVCLNQVNVTGFCTAE